MTIRLNKAEVTGRIAALRQSLTGLQTDRLTAIRDLLDGSGRFRLRAALEAGRFPEGDARAQDAFQEFLQRVNTLAEADDVDLRLQLEARKISPDGRYGWFTGDPVEKGLLAFTQDAAERTSIGRPVTPEVTELDESRRKRVYVSFDVASRPAAALVSKLRDALAVLSGTRWEISDSHSVGIGENTATARDRLCAEADVIVALISAAYLVTSEERERVFGHRDKVIAFALTALPDGPVDLAPLEKHDVVQSAHPWDELTRPRQRKDYIDELIRHLRKFRPPRSASGDDPSTVLAWMDNQVLADWREASGHVVSSELAETRLRESLLDSRDATSTPPLRAIDRLTAWATDDMVGAPKLCALLGDVGTGKTTTANLFAQHLLDLHKEDPATAPLPILFDLRDLRIAGLSQAMTLDHILDSILDATRPAEVPRQRLNATVVRKRLAAGHTVIIFDGLDEVLVHLQPHDRQLFTRQLWRALTDGPTARMLLTCRTQYFRSIRDEVTFFTGETRRKLRGDDYLALLMLPFRDAQVREYLMENLGRDASAVDRLLETIAAVHDLSDLARRPITLRLIADQVEFIETAKLEGRALRSVDIYAEVVSRWISRDAGKHTLTPDHKRLLMEEIAASLWRSGQNAWGHGEVDDWLLELLDRRPDLRRHYRGALPEQWTADLRTATFLKRDGDSFQFGHRSLFEYFLARYLYRVLSDGRISNGDFTALAMPVPSPETLDFLGQSIAGATEEGRSAALSSLLEVGRQYRPQASELALAYALKADKNGYPGQSLNGVQLVGAALEGCFIGSGGPGYRLPMIGANFSRANLRRATFHDLDLTAADFTGSNADLAEFHRSALSDSMWPGASAVGAILRRCKIDGVDLSRTKTYRTQVLLCSPAPESKPGLLIAPMTTVEMSRAPDPSLHYFVGHTDSVNAVAWSPDNTRVLTASDDNSALIWEATTGRQLYRLSGHTGRVAAAAWSFENDLILTGSSDGSARVWDATTGRPIRQLIGHTGSIDTVAWSPGNTLIITGGSDNSALIWDAATGVRIHDLIGHTGSVDAVAWSPDSSRAITGSSDGTARIWDAASGRQLHHLARHMRHAKGIRTVAWSPDNSRVATSGIQGGIRIWDAASGRQLRELSRPAGFAEYPSWAQAIAWSPVGKNVVASGEDGIARIWDVDTGREVRQLARHAGSVNAVAWSPDNTRVATGGDDNGAKIWDSATGHQIHELAGQFGTLTAVAWSPDGSRIATSGSDNSALIWDATTGHRTRHLAGHTDWVRAIAWSPDNTRVLTGSEDSTARIWDADTGQQIHQLTGHTDWVRAIAWSPDNTRVLTAVEDEGVRVWEAATGEEIHRFAGDLSAFTAVAWSPDSTRILTSGIDNSASIWDAITGRRVLRLVGNFGAVTAVDWSPDNTRILTGSTHGGIRVWDALTGRQIRQVIGDTDWARAVAWSPDNTRILTGSTPGGVRIWDAVTGRQIRRLSGHADWARAIAWSPDGTSILTGSTDGSARIWHVEGGQGADLTFVALPHGEATVYEAAADRILGASAGAWRWLGWNTVRDGELTRLPADAFGPLPPLHPTEGTA